MTVPDCPECEGHRTVANRFRRKVQALEGRSLQLEAEIAKLKLQIFNTQHDEHEHQYWLERKVHLQRVELNRIAERQGE